jgi:heptosyltransferase-2
MRGQVQKDWTDIVWLQTAFIGDVVLTTGAIALAAKKFPGIRQHVISTAAGCEVLKGSPHLSGRFSFSKRESVWTSFKNLRERLHQAHIDPKKTVLIQVHRSLRSTLLSRYLGMSTITYDETVFSFLAEHRVKRDRNEHEVVRVASLLAPLGVSLSEIAAVKPHLQEHRQGDLQIWQKEIQEYKGRLLALAVGSQWGTKRWLIESYIELAKRLVALPDVAVVLLGSQEERVLTDAVAKELTSLKGVFWNLAGQTHFDDLRWVFPKLDLLVSNDSSPVHFASAFNIPTVAIFGPTVPSFGFGPLSDHSVIVEHKSLPCRPCSDHGPQTCPLKHFRCMRELSVDQVYEAVLKNFFKKGIQV